jgi:hypothetical protein
MLNFGDAAVVAARTLGRSPGMDPGVAWARATLSTFPNSESMQTKGCPKGAFLGLCEEGLVEGVPPGSYTRSQSNKQYAINAVARLRQSPTATIDRAALWRVSSDDPGKAHNGQMDVVLALWKAGLIRR